MKYKYIWQEVDSINSSLSSELVNAHLTIHTNSGNLVLEESYVPLLDLVNRIEDWDLSDKLEYSPDGYEQNPMISFEAGSGIVRIDSPDIRSASTYIEIDESEFIEFRNSISRDVRRDKNDLLKL